MSLGSISSENGRLGEDLAAAFQSRMFPSRRSEDDDVDDEKEDEEEEDDEERFNDKDKNDDNDEHDDDNDKESPDQGRFVCKWLQCQQKQRQWVVIDRHRGDFLAQGESQVRAEIQMVLERYLTARGQPDTGGIRAWNIAIRRTPATAGFNFDFAGPMPLPADRELASFVPLGEAIQEPGRLIRPAEQRWTVSPSTRRHG
ncbi:MAG: hypothetical protein M1819_001348 [Sarea resinae]|nr:MAG: hypothetical protein M1819_001348 [Sarea resinae]